LSDKEKSILEQMPLWQRKIISTREMERRKIVRDITYFFENYMFIENKDGKTPEERSVLFKMFPEQKRVLEEIESKSKNVIIKARQLGLTWLAVGYGTHGCIRTQQYTVAILSQTEEYMFAAIDRVEYVLMRLPKWLMQEYKKETAEHNSTYLYEKKSDEVIIYHPTGVDGVRVTSKINGYVSTERSGRSITADLIILDEWAFHDNAELVFAGIGPTINRPDSGKLIGISTNKRGSFFEEIVLDCIENNAEMGFNLLFLSVFADPRRTQEWYEQTKKTFKNTWRQEYPEKIEDALSAGDLTAFPEFSREIHVCEPFEIPKHWVRWASCDNGMGGTRDPFCWLKAAISEDGTTYVYYEYSTEKGKGDSTYYSDQAVKFMDDCKIDITDEVRQEIESYHLGFETDEVEQYAFEKLQYVVFGLDAFNKDVAKGTGKSLMDIYKNAGFSYPAVKAVTERKLGKDTIHEYLKPFDDLITGKKTAKLQIFNSCKYLISHLPKLVVDENNPNVIAGNSAIDNTADALKYLLIGSPRNGTQKIEMEETNVAKFKKSKIKKLHGRKQKGVIN
jgi:hypothetical protein